MNCTTRRSEHPKAPDSLRAFHSQPATKGPVTNYGEGGELQYGRGVGYNKGRGGAGEVLHLQRGVRKSFSHSDGGAKKVLR